MTVYLVGAGPGDPGLLTRRGAELLARADVVVYDRLVDPAILALAPAGAELLDVGKRPERDAPGRPGRQQDEINQLLVERGAAADCVVRLKGGDPFVFGRGGVEVEALRAAGIPWEVVPGVSSAVAVPELAGVPVTHRGVSSSFTVVTGHGDGPETGDGVDWPALAAGGDTLVVLMGMANRARIAEWLVAGGRPATTPVAVVEWGSTPRQRTVRTTLAGLAGVDLGNPAVIVVGEVAALELQPPAGPLSGRTVVVTRVGPRPSGLSGALRSAGAQVVDVPVVDIVAPADGGAALAAAAGRLDQYDWVAFTSANAVRALLARVRDGRAFGRARLAAVGPATAAALADAHLEADLVPETATAQGLLEVFPDPPAGGRVLVPRAARGLPTLPEGLVARGWAVDEVEAYRTVPSTRPPAEVTARLAGADAVVFTSPSGIEAFLGAGAPPAVPAVVACIGPVTGAAARTAGLAGVLEASDPTPRGLVAALVAHWAAFAEAGPGS